MRSPERRKGQAAIIIASFSLPRPIIAKLLYWRGVTEVSLFLLRCIFVTL